MAKPKYDDLSRDELLRLLESRDRRDATRFGLVWEANEIERDKALNADFVALDLDMELSCPKPGAAGANVAWKNLIIEGDNFDALRYLRMTFAGRVKCILIDPPYNTGKQDFVYNDRFVGKDDLWRFSTWIEFLYQRISIARDLLAADGVLLCCINDENRAKLELLLDKALPGRRIGSFVWRTKDSANDSGGNLSQVHEHILVYANPSFSFSGKPIDLSDYRNPDNDPRGLWTQQPITCPKTLTERENLYYPIQDPSTGYWYPCDPNVVWRYATKANVKPGTKLRAETIEELIEKKEIYFPPCDPTLVMQWESRELIVKAIKAGKGPRLPKKKTAILREDLPDLDFWVGKPIAPGRPSRKDFLEQKEKLVASLSSWIAGQNEDMDDPYNEPHDLIEQLRSPRGGEGTDAVNEILGNKAFNHPKPPTLIRNLVRQSAGRNDLVVDFFAGSGTTAHAVLDLNAIDDTGAGGGRRFIMVSSTEATIDEPDKNLCRDVCATRVRRVIEGYGDTPGLGGDFAYLRTRRIAPGHLTEIDHSQVWTALQLLHMPTLAPLDEEAKMAIADFDGQRLIYVPHFRAKDAKALVKAATECPACIVYTWQPESVKTRLRDAANVQIEAVPESLARHFGMRI